MKRVIYTGREPGYSADQYPPTITVVHDEEADTVLLRLREHAVIHYHENGAHFSAGPEHEIELSRNAAAGLMDALRALPGPRVELPADEVVVIGK